MSNKIENIKHVGRRPSLLSASVAVALGVIGSSTLVAPVLAAEEVFEEIVVTGSRIVRRDFEANSPIVTVENELFENSSVLGIETVLNQLPQFVPALSQFVTADVQNSPTNSVGSATVDLRGLGANRNLILMDGRRVQPVNALLVVDTNTIPSSAIERVEVVTGGASATYGADAVSGVVNFIMKKNFEGFEIDTQYGETQEGDGSEWKTSALIGTNFADGRGNVMLGMEYAKRGAALQNGRDFYEDRNSDPTVNGTEFFYSDTYVGGLGFVFQPDDATLPPEVLPAGQAVVDSIFDQIPAGSVNPDTNFFINEDGSLYTGGTLFGNGDPSGAYRYNGELGGFRKFTDEGAIGENQQRNFVSFPLDRYSIFARGNYDLTDNLNVYLQANYSNVNTETVLQYSPAVGPWAVQIPHGTDLYAPSVGNTDYQAGGSIGLNCPVTGCTNTEAFPVPSELAALLDARVTRDVNGVPDAPGSNANSSFALNRVLDFIGPRRTRNSTQTFQVVAGLTGDLEIIDGSWDLYTSYGESDVASQSLGFGDLENYRNIVTSANYGRGAAAGGAFSQGTANCTTGLPIFTEFTPSQDCVDSIAADLTDLTRVDQFIVEATVQGTVMELPAGEMRFAAGASYRENKFGYDVSSLNSSNNSSSTVIGLFFGASVAGETETTDFFAEVAVPVLNDQLGVNSMNLELGVRTSDYGPDDVTTWKALGDLEVNDYVSFRGGLQKAIRAPNIGELFSPPSLNVGGTAYGDPCETNSTAPWGAANTPAVIALCSELMGSVGAAAFYLTPPTGAAGTIVTTTEAGNPNLSPEEAETTTFGVVLSSPFESALLSNMTASIDWYEIDISDTIGSGSYDSVYEQCLSAGSNPSQTVAGNENCGFILRNPVDGTGGTTNVLQANVGKFKTSGIDLQFNWSADLADLGLGDNGGLSVNVLVNFLDEYLSQDTAESAILDSAGTGADGGQFDNKTFTTINYFNGPATVSLRWRHYPGIDHESKVVNPATTTRGTDSYDIVDLNGTWTFNETYSVRAGISNLFDADPEIYGATPDTTAAGSTLTGYYDVLGRQFYIGVKARF